MPKLSDIPAAAQAALIAVLIAILAGAGFYYYVWPLSPEIDSVKGQVQKLKAENDQNEVFRRQQVEYLNRIQEMQKKLETLRSIIPDEQATDQFMTMVYDAGITAGIRVRTFVAQALVPHDFYIEMPFTVRLDGTYYSLLGFFGQLFKAQRIVSVTGLTMGAPAGGGMGAYAILPSETVGANCVLTTYFNKPSAAAAPAKK